MTREEARCFLEKCRSWFRPYTSEEEKWDEALDMAIEALSADVVRCKDCRHFKKIVERSDSGVCYRDIVASVWKENSYCSRGERRKP